MRTARNGRIGIHLAIRMVNGGLLLANVGYRPGKLGYKKFETSSVTPIRI